MRNTEQMKTLRSSTNRHSEEKIEAWVRERRTQLAEAEIDRFVRASGRSEESLLLACDWLRRLGRFKRALEILAPALDTKKPSGRLQFWWMRILNLAGASTLALEWVERVQPATAEDWRILANVYLSNERNQEALTCFQKSFQLQANPSDYQSRLGKIGMADAAFALGKKSKARTWVEEVFHESSEPLLQGISLSVLGEYLARDGEYNEAKSYFSRAKQCFSEEDRSLDRAFLLKWEAVAEAGLGEKKRASELFSEAISLMQEGGVRPEAIYAVRCEMKKADCLNVLEQRLLRQYRFLVGDADEAEPVELQPRAEIFLDLDAEEGRLGKNLALGISLELKLLGYLRLAEAWGCSQTQLFGLLWAGQSQSFLQLESRLQQLLRRLRSEYGVEVFSENGVVRLEKSWHSRVGVRVGARNGRPTVFGRMRNSAYLRTSDVGEFYQLGRTQAVAWVGRWVQRGWLVEEGVRPRLKYRIK